jgi:CMP-N-acetylneuraminic acid synthetase
MLGGRPLLTHTVEAALASRRLHRVIVSTDDEKIAEVARAAGAEVPFLRPAQYATDTAPSISVAHHALAWLSVEGGRDRPDAVALLAPTSPFRTGEQIDAVVDLMWQSGADSGCTIVRSPVHPYYLYTRSADGRLSFVLEVPSRPLRRQDLPVFHTHAQAVLVSRTDYLKLSGDDAPFLNFRSVVGVEIDEISAHDIDTPLDMEIAEQLYRGRAERVMP